MESGLQRSRRFISDGCGVHEFRFKELLRQRIDSDMSFAADLQFTRQMLGHMRYGFDRIQVYDFDQLLIR